MGIHGIDHLVLACAELSTAAAPWERLGMTLTPPMRHRGASTENQVFFVGGPGTEFYVELLRGAEPAGEVRLMLQVDDATWAVDALADVGVETHTRHVRRDDGSRIGTVVEPRTDRFGCRVGLIEYAGGATARVDRHRAAGMFDHSFPLQRLDHLAVISGSLDDTCAFWADALGVEVIGEVRGRGMIIRQLSIGGTVLELIGPDGPQSPVAERRPGLVPVAAFEVGDLEGAVALARARGFTVSDPGVGVLPGSRVATIAADEMGGLALQLITFAEQSTRGPLAAVPEDWQRALAVVAHPDDLEYGPASAVARWTAQGKTVVYCMVTSGEAGIDSVTPDECARLRQEDERRAAAVVGVSEVEFLAHPDGLVEASVSLRRDLATMIRRHRPDVLIGINFREAWPSGFNHADHRAVGVALVDAARDAGNRWIFPGAGGEPWNRVRFAIFAGSPSATHAVDVTGTIGAGVASLSEHKTYLDALPAGTPGKDPGPFLRGLAALDGPALGVEAAVSFELVDL